MTLKSLQPTPIPIPITTERKPKEEWLIHCTTHLEVEHEPTTFVESFVRADDQLEVEQIIRIGEFRGARLGQIQLIDVYVRSSGTKRKSEID